MSTSIAIHNVFPDFPKPVINLKIRKAISLIESKLKLIPDSLGEDPFPLEHSFAEGIYIRKIFIPKGYWLIGKIHKHSYINFVESGDISVLTESGMSRIKAPCTIHSPSGTKRFGYSHLDTVWVTVHSNPTNEKSIKKLKEKLYTSDYSELGCANIEFPVDGNDDHPMLNEFIEKTIEIERDLYDFNRFRKLTKEIYDHEKYGFWSDWSNEQQEIYMSGDWELFSRSRGYTEDEIDTLREWIEMKEDGERLNLNPLESVLDLSLEHSSKNIENDTKGEIMLSSHIPTISKFPYKHN
jgi:hypothetical protein